MIKRNFLLTCLFAYLFCFSLALSAARAQQAVPAKEKVVILITEQNINGPKTGWWASEIDLSVAQSVIGNRLLEAGFEVMDTPANSGKAYRQVDSASPDPLKVAEGIKADYVVYGNALATSGGLVPQSSMRSCYASISVKAVKKSDGKLLASFNESGNSAHMDPIAGGKEALSAAAEKIALKLVNALQKK